MNWLKTREWVESQDAASLRRRTRGEGGSEDDVMTAGFRSRAVNTSGERGVESGERGEETGLRRERFQLEIPGVADTFLVLL